jgi:hypothetical protein
MAIIVLILFVELPPRHPLTGSKYGRAYQASVGYQPR